MKAWFVALALLLAPTSVASAQEAETDALPAIAGEDSRITQARAEIADYDDDAGEALLKAACDDKVLEACRGLLGYYDQEFGDGSQERARAVAQELCDAKDPIGCALLARYAENGTGGPVDRTVQRAALLTACDGGLSGLCPDVASLFYNAYGGPEDKAKALTLVKKACDGGVSYGCSQAGHWSEQASYNVDVAENGEQLMTEARSLFLRSCELNDAEGCSNAARLMMRGEGGPVDMDGAMPLLDKACTMNIYHCESRVRAVATRP